MPDWDERYRRGEHTSDRPSPLLAQAIKGLTPGTALDVACGVGRHAIFLAEHGWQVTAVDASRVGIDMALDRARRRGVRLDARVADLERGEFLIAPEAYDLVCIFYYLQRDLFPHIRAGVRPGGFVVAAIHVFDEDLEARSRNPAFLLHPGELRGQFPGWQIIHDGEAAASEPGHHQRQTAELIARKPQDGPAR